MHHERLEHPLVWQAIGEINANAYYGEPKGFDIDYQLRLVSAKRDKAADDLWALREDPNYFKESVEETMGRFEAVWRSQRESQLALAGDTYNFRLKSALPTPACCKTITMPYTRLILWDYILEDLTFLKSLQNQGNVAMYPGRLRDHETQSMKALFGLVALFSASFLKFLGELKGHLVLNTPLKKYYTIETPPSYSTEFPTAKLEIDEAMRDQLPESVILLEELFDVNKRSIFGVPKLMDELQKFLQPENLQASWITAPVAKQLSDVAALGELHVRLDQHQPRIRRPKDYKVILNSVNKRLESI